MTNQATKTKKGYTWVQYFFWLFTGAEISLLKDCPTDYNRQAGIGFTIFMTTLFAMFAGGYAGYYFTLVETSRGVFEGSYASAIVFGLIWGLLIFSIDRSLVVSLKKKPKSTDEQSGLNRFLSFIGLFGGQFLTRAIVGGLIAFVISIPLEILIFKENISIQMEKDKVNEEKEFVKLLNETKQTSKVEKQRELNEVKKVKAEDAMKDCNNAPGYSEQNRLYSLESGKLSALESERRSLGKSRDEAYNNVPVNTNNEKIKKSREWDRYINGVLLYNRKRSEVNTQRALVNSIDSKRRKICEDFRDQKRSEAIAADLLATNAVITLDSLTSVIDSTTTVTTELLRTQRGFTRQFAALGNAAKDDGDVLLLLWLIRAIFFLIEILPTVVKLATPFGAYDALVYNKEKNFEEVLLPKIRQDLEWGIDISSAQDSEVALAINENEKALRLKMVEEISRVQLEIANQYLAEYERVARSQAPRQVQEFINRQA